MCLGKDLRRNFGCCTILVREAGAADSARLVGVALRVPVGQVGGSVKGYITHFEG